MPVGSSPIKTNKHKAATPNANVTSTSEKPTVWRPSFIVSLVRGVRWAALLQMASRLIVGKF
jgi:hypothetical protein